MSMSLLSVEVEVNVDPEDVLHQLDVEDVIEYYTQDTILDEIGKDKVMEYFDLTEKKEQK